MNQAKALRQYSLQGVRETGVELGRGSYATVYTVEYKGLTCAAKKLHQALYEPGQGIGYAAGRFQEECAILSELRHPNIVQFLGVYHQDESILPVLVMEYLPMTLAQCLDKYGVLPNEVSYSILKDVALALSYLHQHNPAIVHRDLSSNNVLLTSGMTAKISDLGVAKILDLNPTHLRTMTKIPGTLCYMPPEALVENSRYSSKVDVFSFGILMIHLFTGQWPFPTEPVIVDPQDDSQMIPQSEADRRQQKLDVIGRDHPMMNLMLDCIHNSPARRPEAVEILREVSQVAAHFPSSENKVELLRQMADTEKLQQSKEIEIGSLRADIESLQQVHDAKLESTISSIVRLKHKHATELEKNMQALQESQRQLEDAERCHSVEVEQLNLKLADTKDTLSSKLCEMETKLTTANRQTTWKNSEVQQLHQSIREKEAEFHDVLQSNEELLSSKEFLLASKDSIISGLQEQLDHLRKSHTAQVLQAKEREMGKLLHNIVVLCKQVEYLNMQLPEVPIPFPQGAKLGQWKKCIDAPNGMYYAQAVVIRGIVYVGGGADPYLIHEYSPTRDRWSTSPPAPVRLFGMGELNGQLVIVGGMTKGGDVTGKVHMIEGCKWKESIPPMPTARRNLAVFSQPSCLTVIGGCTKHDVHLSVVEVFITHTSLWHKALPAPSSLSLMSMTTIQNKCFLAEYYSYKVHQLSVSVHQATEPRSTCWATTKWNQLTDLPYQKCSLVSHNGCLFAVGGEDKSLITKTIHAFFPKTKTWKRIGDLPEPRRFSTAVHLSTAEILVMGGEEKSSPWSKKVWRTAII